MPGVGYSLMDLAIRGSNSEPQPPEGFVFLEDGVGGFMVDDAGNREVQELPA